MNKITKFALTTIISLALGWCFGHYILSPILGWNRPEIKVVIERPVYEDSIKPGGVYTQAEAAASIYDPVIRQHYAEIDISKLRPWTLDRDLEVYVSYRNNGKIYWKRTTLKKGEIILSDGKNWIRARCGNLIRLLEEGPPDQDNPVFKLSPNALVTSFDGTIPYVPENPVVLTPETPTGGDPRISFSLIPMPPIVVERAQPVPEPDTVELMFIGFVILAIFWLWSKR